jgi:hypothetical protein
MDGLDRSNPGFERSNDPFLIGGRGVRNYTAIATIPLSPRVGSMLLWNSFHPF